jgi:hypothetical protein
MDWIKNMYLASWHTWVYSWKQENGLYGNQTIYIDKHYQSYTFKALWPVTDS